MRTYWRPHIAATRQRMQEHATVLCVQDTTQLDYTGQTQIEGLGPLTYENQSGFYLHPTLAITPDRLCLGVIGSKTWARDAEHHGKENERKKQDDRRKGELPLDYGLSGGLRAGQDHS